MARNKGSGTLVKRGKYYMARWVVNGKIYTRTTKCTERREALIKLAEFTHPYQTDKDIETLENLQSQINVLREGRNSTPIEKSIRLIFAIDEYKKNINQSALSDITEARYNSQFNVLRKFINKEYVYEVNEQDAEKFMRFIKDKSAIQTYNSYLKVFKRVFAVLMEMDSNIKRNPFAKFKVLRDSKLTYRRGLTKQEIDKLIEIASRRSFDGGLYFKLGAYTGLRREDCWKLKKSEVDLENRKIRRVPIKTMKTGITAVIPISDELYDDLKTAMEMNPESEYVLPRIAGWTSYYLSEFISEIFTEAHIKTHEIDSNGKLHFTTGFHSFRHTLTKKLYKDKIPLNQIMMILGHKTVDMSLHYGSATESDIEAFDFKGDSANVTLSRKTIDTLHELGGKNDTIDDVVKMLLESYKTYNRQKYIQEIEEIKKRESDEWDRIIDEVMRESEGNEQQK